MAARVAKILAWLVAGFALLLVIAVVAVSLFFDLNDYKPKIIELVKQKTGGDLSIHGDIEITLLPAPGASFGALELANAEGFGPKPLARIESGTVHLKPLPLVKKEIEIADIVVSGLDLNLSRAKSGKTNWEDLQPKDQGAPAKGSTPAVGSIRIADSKVIWDDQMTGKRLSLDKLDLRIGALKPKENFPVALESAFAAGDLAGHVELDSKVFADLDDANFRIRDALMTAVIAGKQIPEKLDLKLQAREAALEGEIFTLEGFRLEGLGIALEANLRGKGAESMGTLKLDEFSPREVMRQLGVRPPQTADPKVLSKASLSMEIKGEPRNLDLNKLSVKLDDSALTGDIAIKNLSDPAILFALVIDKIDLDRYRPKASPERADEPPTLEWLRGQNIQGKLRIGELKVVEERASDFLIAVDTRE